MSEASGDTLFVRRVELDVVDEGHPAGFLSDAKLIDGLLMLCTNRLLRLWGSLALVYLLIEVMQVLLHCLQSCLLLNLGRVVLHRGACVPNILNLRSFRVSKSQSLNNIVQILLRELFGVHNA